jgi:hypothetical protein
MKVEYDGTNVKFYAGPDGFNWVLLLKSETKATFFTTAPDQVVWFGCNLNNSGTGTATATELSRQPGSLAQGIRNVHRQARNN